MAVKRISSDIDVVTAARQRIKNVFSNGVPVYLSFSGGKDSIVLADLTYKLIQAGEINPSQLTVLFVDEEAIFDSIEATTKAWRKKFLLAGAKFQWWCIEVKHFSCLNELSSDETFVCWDRRKRDVWVRQPPPFAIRNHPQLRPRIDNYQSFLPRVTMDGIMITGVRAAESIQRLQYMAALNMGAKGITGTNTIYPIYDWKTADVWLYLRDQRIEVPEVYLQMYQVGVNRNQLRVSQFFSVDTVPVLVHLGEYDPSLMERVLRREPNAYLAMLYWDSEMFHRTTRKRRELEGEDTKDYRALLKEMLFVRPGDFFNTEHKRKIAKQYRKMFIQMDGMARPRDYKKMYGGLLVIPSSAPCAPSIRTYPAPTLITPSASGREVRQMADADLFAPLSSLQWVDREQLKPNDYNPNKVNRENLKLLVQSIMTNGWTLPIVVRPDYTIIDGFHRWTVAGEEPLHTMLKGKVPVVIVRHDDATEDIYGTVTHNRARGTHLLEPMKAIVKRLLDEGKSVQEIGKQLGMKPEEVFRLSDFSRDDFLGMMTKGVKGYSHAELLTKL